MLITFTFWYGEEATCYHCGAHYGCDGGKTPGRHDVAQVRERWHRTMTTDASNRNPPARAGHRERDPT